MRLQVGAHWVGCTLGGVGWQARCHGQVVRLALRVAAQHGLTVMDAHTANGAAGAGGVGRDAVHR